MCERLKNPAKPVACCTTARALPFKWEKNSRRTLDNLFICQAGGIMKSFITISRFQVGVASLVSPAANRPNNRDTGNRIPLIQGLPVIIF
jgi:hypothetical protein